MHSTWTIRTIRTIRTIIVLALTAFKASGADIDEFKVKREEVFEFVSKPMVVRTGKTATIAFESKAFCDVTVAVETGDGKILRHLASGVLGSRAPEPFQKDSKRQTIEWDGKDDQGEYISERTDLTIRVSLGLKAIFEKNLYWSPHKRISSMPVMSAAPEGVYVYDGYGLDHLRLFSHTGDYLRTIHPYPADKIKEVEGLTWKDFPEGYKLPTKYGFYQQTLLNSGTNESIEDKNCRYGWAAMGMVASGKRIALTYKTLNRLATDGSTGGLPLNGPAVGLSFEHQGYGGEDNGTKSVGPSSLAFSPDQKTLYMTAYVWFSRFGSGAVPAVMKLDFESNKPPEVFTGKFVQEGGWGDGEKQLNTPMSVDTDAQGRVYVADFMNDRIQVFAPDGSLLKSIKAEKPAKVLVHKRSGEIYVLNWAPRSIPTDVQKKTGFNPDKPMATTVRIFSAMPEPKLKSTDPINLGYGDPGYYFALGQLYQVELDSWTDTPKLWTVGRKHFATEADEKINGSFAAGVNREELWKNNIEIQQRKDGKWQTVFSFAEAAQKEAGKLSTNKHKIQYLWFNPKSERLYIGEPDSGPTCKACNSLLKVDPDSGATESVRLPFNALDVAFDLEGNCYLRSTDLVTRYDPETWREVPWDYGDEVASVGNDGSIGGHTTSSQSALVIPASSPVCYHQGGMDVSAQGNLIVSCHNRDSVASTDRRSERFIGMRSKYELPLFPGCVVNSTSASVHVWDKHGKIIHRDAISGLPQLDGVSLDARGDVYVLATPSRIYDGTKYFNDMSETMMKFKPGAGKCISTAMGNPIPFPSNFKMDRPPEIYNGAMGSGWANGAEWFFGGVGFAGFNSSRGGGGCACWHARFKLDYFGRSFVPAPFQYNIAVLDANGNLILRIGKYGNVDSSGPNSPVPVGGDGIGLFNACYVTTHTDHRLFISDSGNARVFSAKLDYYATEKISLK